MSETLILAVTDSIGEASTMSSREIGELVESRHTDVCRAIERLIAEKVIGGYAPTAYTHPQNVDFARSFLSVEDGAMVSTTITFRSTWRESSRWSNATRVEGRLVSHRDYLAYENVVQLPSGSKRRSIARVWSKGVTLRCSRFPPKRAKTSSATYPL